jgi:hypothetical protein
MIAAVERLLGKVFELSPHIANADFLSFQSELVRGKMEFAAS